MSDFVWVRLGMLCVLVLWLAGAAWIVAAIFGVHGAIDKAIDAMQWSFIGWLLLRPIMEKRK